MSATPSNASVEDFGKRSIDEQVDRADRAYRTHSAALISNLETRLGRRAEAAEIEACVKQDPLLASSPTPAKILRIGMESRAAKHRNPQAVAIMTQALQQQRQRQLGLSSGGSDNNVDLEQRLLRARNGAVDVLQLIEDLGPQPTLAEAERYIFDKQRSATATRDAAGILPRAVSSATLPTTPSFMPQVTQPIFSGATPSATSPVVPPATPYATPPHARPEIVLPTTPFTAPPVMQTAAAHTTPHATPSRIPVTSASRQYARPPTTSSITMSEERMRDVILETAPLAFAGIREGEGWPMLDPKGRPFHIVLTRESREGHADYQSCVMYRHRTDGQVRTFVEGDSASTPRKALEGLFDVMAEVMYNVQSFGYGFDRMGDLHCGGRFERAEE